MTGFTAVDLKEKSNAENTCQEALDIGHLQATMLV